MKIDKLIIKSFKSILDIELELGNLNIFIGANGSGKSNILEALGVLSAAASGRVDDESLLRRGVRPGVPRLYKSAFHQMRLPPHIYFEAMAEKASYKVTLNNPLENPKPAWQFKSEHCTSKEKSITRRGPKSPGNKDQGLAALKIAELTENDPANVLLTSLRDYGIYTPETPILRGMVQDQHSREPIGLSGGNIAEAVNILFAKRFKESILFKNEKLMDAIDEFLELVDWMQHIETSNNVSNILSSSVPRPRRVLKLYDRYMRKGKNQLTAYDVSEGALYVLFYAVLTLSSSVPKLIAIDNLDQTLNPRLVQNLVRKICKWLPQLYPSRQILATVHNPSALDGLPLQDDRIRLFAVDRDNEGHTNINRIIIDESLVKLSKEKGWPLSRLWVMGMIGGVPDV